MGGTVATVHPARIGGPWQRQLGYGGGFRIWMRRATDPDPDVTPDPDSALAAYLPRFAACTVLVLGDVMLDRYVLGDVRRISPEAPIPVLHAQARRSVLGGAGNVAQNIAALGARAVLVGLVGADAPGAEIGQILDGSAGVTARLVSTPDRPTTVKTRFMSGAHQLLRLDEEVSHAVGPDIECQVLAAFAAALPTAGAVVISDYAKGLLTDTVLAQAIALARAAGLSVVVDPKRTDLSAYRHAGVLTPNAAELARATSLAVADRRRGRRRRRPRADPGRGRRGAGEALGKRADPDHPRAARRCTCRPGRERSLTSPAPATRSARRWPSCWPAARRWPRRP